MGESSSTELKINGYLLSDGQHDNVWSLAWNPQPLNGAELMLASSGDRTIVWQYKDSKWSQFAQLNNRGKGTVRCCAWRMDGIVFATGSADSKVTLWRYDQATATPSFAFMYQISAPSEQVVKCLTWNKEGMLLTCTDNGYICILGVNDDGQYEPKCRVAVSDIAETSCITWHPNGKYFAVGGHKCIKILNVQETGSSKDMAVNEILKIQQVWKCGTCAVRYSCNGTTIASAGRDGQVALWKLEETHSSTDDPQLVHHLLGTYAGAKSHMCFDWSRCQNNSIGFLLASGSHQNEICVHAPKNTGKKIVFPLVAPKITDAHDGPITDLKWHHENPGLLASASRNGSVKIWRVEGQTYFYSPDEVPAGRHKSSPCTR